MSYINNYNRILIIGFRCVGKTTISKELAEILNFECLDVDKLIEQEQGCSINEITENGKNWANFRELETMKIKELLSFDNVVIAGGGGLGVNDVNFNESVTYGEIQKEIINRSSDTLKILLEADEEVIRKRLKNGKITRPDLSGKSFNEEEYIENNLAIMRKRKKDYEEMANIVINTNDDDTLKNVNKIIAIIEKGGVKWNL